MSRCVARSHHPPPLDPYFWNPEFHEFPRLRDNQSSPSSPLQTITRFKDKPLDFNPGEKHGYSNSGYILLGYVIEQAPASRMKRSYSKTSLSPCR